jgi:serine/threonine-protein kinase
MAYLHRVWDPDLARSVALKLMRPELAVDPAARRRFVREARATAGLQHPGIVPVHDLGHLPDGTPFYTMKEVQGRTLAQVIAEALAGRRGAGPSGWTLRRLVEAFHRVCDAVAYAHAQGVIHRDLKPSNVMLGPFGEVMVVDWGLARRVGPAAGHEDDDAPGDPDLAGDRGDAGDAGDAGTATHAGMVSGTPAYMPPEQAEGVR